MSFFFISTKYYKTQLQISVRGGVIGAITPAPPSLNVSVWNVELSGGSKIKGSTQITSAITEYVTGYNDPDLKIIKITGLNPDTEYWIEGEYQAETVTMIAKTKKYAFQGLNRSATGNTLILTLVNDSSATEYPVLASYTLGTFNGTTIALNNTDISAYNQAQGVLTFTIPNANLGDIFYVDIRNIEYENFIVYGLTLGNTVIPPPFSVTISATNETSVVANITPLWFTNLVVENITVVSGPSGTYNPYTRSITFDNLNPAQLYRAVLTSGVQNAHNVVFRFSTLGYVAPVCFLGDAPVLTPRGYRPIHEFRVGDLVTTAEGRTVAVKRVFQRSYGPSAAVNPYIIPKGFLGATRPIAISPNHEVMIPGRGMMKAKDLGLRRMKMATDFTYYNLELEDWVRDNLVVGGVVVESLAPAGRITMTKAEFAAFVKARYGPAAAARLRSVCFEAADGKVSLPQLM